MKKLILLLLMCFASIASAWTTNSDGTAIILYEDADPLDNRLINTNLLLMLTRLDAMYSDAGTPLAEALYLWTNGLGQIDWLNGVGASSAISNMTWNGERIDSGYIDLTLEINSLTMNGNIDLQGNDILHGDNGNFTNLYVADGISVSNDINMNGSDINYFTNIDGTNGSFANNVSIGGLATLSNVTISGTVASDIDPDADDTRDLGDSSLAYRNIYVSTASVDVVNGGTTISGDLTLGNSDDYTSNIEFYHEDGPLSYGDTIDYLRGRVGSFDAWRLQVLSQSDWDEALGRTSTRIDLQVPDNVTSLRSGISILSITNDLPYVGIGTEAPTARLHVLGEALISANASIGTTLDVTGASSFGANMDMENNSITNLLGPVAAQDATTKNYVDTNDCLRLLSANGTATNLAIAGSLDTGNNWLSGDGDSEGIVIDDSGNVGIKINTPARDVHIVGTGIRTSLANADTRIEFENSASTNIWAIGLDYSANQALSFAYRGGVVPSLTSDMLLTILTNGNVGIGTNSPSATLDVDGTLEVTGASSFGANMDAQNNSITNLADVLPGTDDANDIGAASLYWRNAYVNTQNVQIINAVGGILKILNPFTATEWEGGLTPTAAYTYDLAFGSPWLTMSAGISYVNEIDAITNGQSIAISEDLNMQGNDIIGMGNTNQFVLNYGLMYCDGTNQIAATNVPVGVTFDEPVRCASLDMQNNAINNVSTITSTWYTNAYSGPTNIYIDFNNGEYVYITLTNDAYINTPSNVACASYTLFIAQDGVGGHTCAWDSVGWTFGSVGESYLTGTGADGWDLYRFVGREDSAYYNGKSNTTPP